MKIVIASDHAGFEQKGRIVEELKALGHSVKDFGPRDAGRVDYPDFAADVARDVSSGHSDFGVLVCGTGIGMAIAANKTKGVRAANVTDPEFARLAREHNDANVLAISGRFRDLSTNLEIVRNFLETPFAGGRHKGRVEKIHSIESE
jgi:ribose 5-phosphate isomerase B